MKEIRKLKANEIEVRVQSVTTKNDDAGAVLLLYKNARVDMAILDETFGALNWSRKHTLIDGNLYCTVSVWDESKVTWVDKQDVGLAANGSSDQAEKARASDGCKRACTCWGIGRELYTAPFTYINLTKSEWYTDSTGKAKVKPSVKFYVSKITYEEDSITELVIVDKDGTTRFHWKREAKVETSGVNLPITEAVNEPLTYKASAEACMDCGVTLTPKVSQFSLKRFGRPLCYKCQKQMAA